MPISMGQIQVPEDGFRIYINNVDYSDHALNYNFKEVDNEVKSFWVDLLGVEESQRSADVLQNKVVRLESNGQLIFKGILEKPDYQTGEAITIRGIGSVESKLRRQLADVTASSSVDSPPLRPIYETQLVKNILSEQIATVSGVTVDVVDDGTEFGSGTFRGDHVNVLSMTVNPVIQKGGKWWSTHGTVSPWADDIFHASASRGSESSVATFNVSGANANANLTENEQDLESLANWVEILGQGDGINQLRSVNFHATTTRSFLDGDVDDSQTTIELVDASAFDSVGIVWIGMERISYTGISTNTLTGVVRGVGSDFHFDDFEDGDITNDPVWTTTTSTNVEIGVQTSVVKIGANALRIRNLDGFASTDGTLDVTFLNFNGDSSEVSAWVRVDNIGTTTRSTSLQFRDSSLIAGVIGFDGSFSGRIS